MSPSFMGFLFTECVLIVLRSTLRGYSAHRPTIQVKGASQHQHLVSELLLHQGNFDTLMVVFQNKNVNM